MKTIIFATSNAGKMREIRQIMADLPVEILSMKEAGIDIDIVEDGKTFEENACIKAEAIRDYIRSAGGDSPLAVYKDAVVLADDSGLEIDHLHKEPGVYSARYMGEDTSYDIKNANLIQRLEGVSDEERTARFVCVIAAAAPGAGETKTCRGTIEGRIGYKPEGDNGFGYDPIFYVPEFGCTTAQLTPEQKNLVSHRGKALRGIKKAICTWL